MIRRHLAVWLTGLDLPLLAVGVAGAAVGVAGTAILTEALATAAGIPVVNVALVLLLVLCLAGSAATAILLSPRPAVRVRADAPAAASPGVPGAAAPTPPTGCGVGAAHTPAVGLSAAGHQASQRGGEVRDVQPAPGVPVLAGAASRCDAGPTTLPHSIEVTPRAPYSGWAPGPPAPSRMEAGWAGRPASAPPVAGRHHHRPTVQLPARTHRVTFRQGRATVGGRP